MLRNYLLVAWKVLLRRKFFTFVSLFGVGLTMMVLLVGVAFLDHTFAPHAPEWKGGRTLGIYRLTLRGPENVMTSACGYGFLSRFRSLTDLPGVERLAVTASPQTAVSYLGQRRIESALRRTDGEFWRVMDFDFLEGGPFTNDDEKNGNFVAVINRATRQRFFGKAAALGRSLEVDGQRFRVVGVVENVPVVRTTSSADVWVPISTSKSSDYKRDWMGPFSALILARRRADFPDIKAEVARRVKLSVADLEDPKNYKQVNAGADTLFEATAREVLSNDNSEGQAGKLWLVLAAAGLLFLTLPTVNLVNINLSRVLERSSEIGVRKAFGASSGTLVGQFVVENIFLTLLGSLVGLALAAGALAAVNASGFIAYSSFALNFRVFLAGLGLALFFGLLSGVYPAWRMSRLHPVYALRGRDA
jgi:putative ABC transport system permease protein